MTVSCIFLFFCKHEKPARARPRRVRATKSPARCPARASRRSFGEYAFLEDSRYASQEENACGQARRRERPGLVEWTGLAPRLGGFSQICIGVADRLQRPTRTRCILPPLIAGAG